MFDYKKNDYFALIKPITGGWSFVSYEHNGESYRGIQGFNRDGVPKNFTVFFGDRERMFMVPKNKTIQVIVNNDSKAPITMRVSEYLIKSGYCVGEHCTNPIFKLIDEDKDAREVVDVKGQRIKAENLALELKGEQLREIAQLLGEFSDNKDKQKRAVLELAGKDPGMFMGIYDDPNRAIKSLVRKAVKSGIMKQTGKVVTWDKEVVGSGEEQWVDYFVKDEVRLKALEKAVHSLK
jgi:hypothetical protein